MYIYIYCIALASSYRRNESAAYVLFLYTRITSGLPNPRKIASFEQISIIIITYITIHCIIFAGFLRTGIVYRECHYTYIILLDDLSRTIIVRNELISRIRKTDRRPRACTWSGDQLIKRR